MDVLSLFDKRLEKKPPWFVANFDSATGLVKALGSCLNGESFAGVGHVPTSKLLARLVNALPWQIQRVIYIKGSAKGSVDPRSLCQIRATAFTRWVTNLFPRQKYRAMLIGSSNGAAVHLGSALGIPWLPQTFLVPVKVAGEHSVDDPIERMKWVKPFARTLLENNPELELHHMMDPNQDRPMLKTTSYFRVKLLRLGNAYEEFILHNLEKNGVLFIVDCQKSWPVTYVGERHFFQFGGLGGNTIDEYLKGSERIKDFLQQNGSQVERWVAPQADGEQPEAEWGFATAMGSDIERLAKENGFKVQYIRFYEPEDFSPFVADLYRWWYGELGIEANRLIAGMFFLIEPYWTLHGGLVPFWLAFNGKPSVEVMKEYLQSVAPYDEIYLMPFSHGVRGLGMATVGDYRSVLSIARRKGDFIGAEPDLYPFDFGIYARYEKEIRKITSKQSIVNDKLTVEQLYHFINLAKDKYKVFWID